MSRYARVLRDMEFASFFLALAYTLAAWALSNAFILIYAAFSCFMGLLLWSKRHLDEED